MTEKSRFLQVMWKENQQKPQISKEDRETICETLTYIAEELQNKYLLNYRKINDILHEFLDISV